MRRGRIVALDALAERPAAALIVDGRLEDLSLDPSPDDPTPRPEEIHRVVVDRPAPAMGGAFVRMAGGATGWLRMAEARPGDVRLAQVRHWPEPGKAVPLSDRPALKGALALLTPGAPGANVSRSVKGRAARERLEALGAAALAGAPADLGLVLRTAAAAAEDEAIVAETRTLRAEWAALAAEGGAAPRLLRPAPDAPARALRDWADPAPDAVDDAPGAFERLGVLDAIEALRRPRADLPGGAWMSVEATAAMVAVDVNTGADVSKGAAQRANLAACAELPRQLRLRGLGGVVLLDPAPIRKGARQGVDSALRRAFADDPVDTQIAGWTPLGNVEILRKRERRPLRDLLDG